MDAKEFGSFITEIRKSSNITQIELARKLNVTDKAVSRWERGLGFPDINTLEPLADALGTGLVELMQAKRNESPEPLSAERVEELLSDTIRLSGNHNKFAKIFGIAVLTLFAITAIISSGLLISDWDILNFIVPSIVAGLIAWSIPIWKMTVSRNTQIAAATVISFGSALVAVLFRIINIAHDINTNDVVAVIDTIDAEVIVVSIFIAITIALNVCTMLCARRS